MDDFYVIYDEDGIPTAAFRKSKVDGIKLGLYGEDVGCHVSVNGSMFFVKAVDVKTFLDNVVEKTTNATYSPRQSECRDWSDILFDQDGRISQRPYDKNEYYIPESNDYYNPRNVAEIREACDAWSKAIDNVMHAAEEYDNARAHYREVQAEVMKRRRQELEIERQKKERGEPNCYGGWEREGRETTEPGLALVPKIDTLNSWNWKFRY